MTAPAENRAERAGRAAKTALRRRRERRRVVGWTAAALLGIPLLFAAVWCRLEVSRALAQRDDLLAQRESLVQAHLRLDGEKTRLATWESLGPRAMALGLRTPHAADVLWVPRGKRRALR
jgi:hypothetical protein